MNVRVDQIRQGDRTVAVDRSHCCRRGVGREERRDVTVDNEEARRYELLILGDAHVSLKFGSGLNNSRRYSYRAFLRWSLTSLLFSRGDS